MIGRHQQFGRQLKEAANLEDPAFCELLHENVMAGVRRERVVHRRSQEWHMGWSLGAVAAAFAVFIGLWVSRHSHQKSAPTELVVLHLPAMPSFGKVVSEAAEPARIKLNDARFAYLDRDGKRLAHFLWHSVPGVPVEQPNKAHGI